MSLKLITAAKDSWACFLLDRNGQTQIYRLVLGSFVAPLRRKHDSLMEEDDCAPPPMLINVKLKSILRNCLILHFIHLLHLNIQAMI